MIERFANGVVVPMPTFPFPRTLKSVLLEELATANSELEPVDDDRCTDSVENGVEVPMPRREFVTSQKKFVDVARGELPLPNGIYPDWIAAQPVPPFVTPSVPETEARLT
jgi:hypothetical protein